MKNGMLLVSGCPRSGTSLCMDIQRVVFGEDLILGEKFPQQNKKLEEKGEKEPDSFYEVRRYIQQKEQPVEEDFKDMNPEGFWEMEFSVAGVIYRPRFKKKLQEVIDGKRYICKVVSQGLLKSDPQYIGGVIYMIRHPRAVAKSQERLQGGMPPPKVEGKEQPWHTPEMYIQVTTQASAFLRDNPEIPILFVHYEELIANPERELQRMEAFTGKDYEKARGVVQPKLNRSKAEDIANPLWQDAEEVYNLFCKQEYDKVIDYMQDPKREVNRLRRSWPCYRAKQIVSEAICKNCLSDPITRLKMQIHSEKIEGEFTKHWSKEPCLFECGMDVDREDYLTIKESIKNNWWSMSPFNRKNMEA